MRVDEADIPQPTDRTEVPSVRTRRFAMILLVGAAVLVATGVYFLAETCWSRGFGSVENPIAAGCRREGAGDAFVVFFLAQVAGAAGFLLRRRTSRNRSGVGRVPETTPRRPVIGRIQFSLSVVLSVVLLGTAGYVLSWALLAVAYSCWAWQGPPVDCSLGVSVVGALLIAFGEALAFAGFLVARRAFRRRPWRRDAPLQPLT